MGTVGAFQWKGGYQQFTSAGQLIHSEEPTYLPPDSYLGKRVVENDL